jgi:hypothetical protein
MMTKGVLKVVAAVAASAAIGLVALAPAAHAETKTCQGVANSAAGQGVATLELSDGNPGDAALLLSRPLFAAPGRGPAAGDVRVQLDLKYVFAATNSFAGLGIEITFPGNGVKTPIDLSVTVADATVSRASMIPNPDGHYSARLGKGPATGNALVDALDKGDMAHVVITAAGQADQVLVNANVPIGTPKEREALGMSAMDAMEAKTKTGC